jgi:hypothetical protein
LPTGCINYIGLIIVTARITGDSTRRRKPGSA